MCAQVLCSVSNPTVMVCKSIAGLVEQQQAAQRIKAEQVGTFMDEVRKLVETYHTTHGLLLSPSPVSLNSFSYFFTIVCRRDRTRAPPAGTPAQGGRPAARTYTCAVLACARRCGSTRRCR